jgi:hypothetical protein
MRKVLTAIGLAAVVALALTSVSAGHTLKKGRAAQEAATWLNAFASYVDDQGPDTWKVNDDGVGTCERGKRHAGHVHAVDCPLVLAIDDSASGDRLGCVSVIRVKFKSARSRKLTSAPVGQIDCGKLDFDAPPKKKGK